MCVVYQAVLYNIITISMYVLNSILKHHKVDPVEGILAYIFVIISYNSVYINFVGYNKISHL